MPRSRRVALSAAVALGAATGAAAIAQAVTSTTSTREYLVVYRSTADAQQARQAITAAGGTVVRENSDVGVAVVRSSADGFADTVDASTAVVGAADDHTVIGRAPQDRMARNRAVEHDQQVGGSPKTPTGSPQKGADPLTGLQWDMNTIGAPLAHTREMGSHGVLVGVIDTGIDGTHPDIAPNFNAKLSRNFTVDDPTIDGPCAEEPDQSCNDPSNVDEDGHGTHVAGTIAAAANGIGITGVAPKVQLVNLRAGQDSGYFFVEPTVNAITYGADIGVDVVNMSFYVDPWLYNCDANPADSPEAQQQQRTIRVAVQRAIDYGRSKGVTFISALGNENTDLNNPTVDDTSPDYPPDAAYHRVVDKSCIDVPTENSGVIAVSSVGPSGRKAYYSNWGTDQTDVSAPGGDKRDFFGTPRYLAPENRILAPYPKNVADAEGTLNPDGTPNTPMVLRDCTKGGVCGYYQYLQGTSMASPHAAGVAALIVSRYGWSDGHGGKYLPPAITERILLRTATDTPCPDPATFTYPDPDLTPDYTATCEGTPEKNGFYGAGIVNAAAVVGLKGH
ncbi:MAG: S8 family serine peptidase [Thermoleophilia bacterium]